MRPPRPRFCLRRLCRVPAPCPDVGGRAARRPRPLGLPRGTRQAARGGSASSQPGELAGSRAIANITCPQAPGHDRLMRTQLGPLGASCLRAASRGSRPRHASAYQGTVGGGRPTPPPASAQGYAMLKPSAINAGCVLPSISMVFSKVRRIPWSFTSSAASSFWRSRTRAPTGTGAVKRNLLSP